nr:9973_t:CDS:2 [Entrophospora candida]
MITDEKICINSTSSWELCAANDIEDVDDIWDDSALVAAWESAVDEYQY